MEKISNQEIKRSIHDFSEEEIRKMSQEQFRKFLDEHEDEILSPKEKEIKDIKEKIKRAQEEWEQISKDLDSAEDRVRTAQAERDFLFEQYGALHNKTTCLEIEKDYINDFDKALKENSEHIDLVFKLMSSSPEEIRESGWIITEMKEILKEPGEVHSSFGIFLKICKDKNPEEFKKFSEKREMVNSRLEELKKIKILERFFPTKSKE